MDFLSSSKSKKDIKKPPVTATSEEVTTVNATDSPTLNPPKQNTSSDDSTADNQSNVRVELAGEVIGLKPPAVAKKPKPPRLFILNRDGEATEIVSNSLHSNGNIFLLINKVIV